MTCFEVETPQSILDGEQIDVFSVILADAPAEFKDQMEGALWAAYRYAGLGSSDRTYWSQCMKDRWHFISKRFIEAFNVYKAYIEGPYTDLNAGSSEVQYIHEDTPDTAIGTASTYMSSRDTTKTRSYLDLPQTTVKQALGDITEPYSMFAQAFSDLFFGRMF